MSESSELSNEILNSIKHLFVGKSHGVILQSVMLIHTAMMEQFVPKDKLKDVAVKTLTQMMIAFENTNE